MSMPQQMSIFCKVRRFRRTAMEVHPALPPNSSMSSTRPGGRCCAAARTAALALPTLVTRSNTPEWQHLPLFNILHKDKLQLHLDPKRAPQGSSDNHECEAFDVVMMSQSPRIQQFALPEFLQSRPIPSSLMQCHGADDSIANTNWSQCRGFVLSNESTSSFDRLQALVSVSKNWSFR
eukprot:1673489-Amphidinium_carterae.2